jgi:hypothetical protein
VNAFSFWADVGSSNSTIIEARGTCFLPRRIRKFFSGVDMCGSGAVKNRKPKKNVSCDLYSLPRELASGYERTVPCSTAA